MEERQRGEGFAVDVPSTQRPSPLQKDFLLHHLEGCAAPPRDGPPWPPPESATTWISLRQQPAGRALETVLQPASTDSATFREKISSPTPRIDAGYRYLTRLAGILLQVRRGCRSFRRPAPFTRGSAAMRLNHAANLWTMRQGDGVHEVTRQLCDVVKISAAISRRSTSLSPCSASDRLTLLQSL